MLKKGKKLVVYMHISPNESGFTLLNMLISIATLLIIFPLLSILIKSASYSNNYEQLAVNQFFHFIQMEVIESVDYSTVNNELTLILPNGNIVTFKQHGHLVQRQVNKAGYEIYLREINDFNFEAISYGFIIKVSLEDGEDYEKKITFYE